jgi:hypothetical protein
MVAHALEERLEPALEDYMTGLRQRQHYDRGSASPVHMPEAEQRVFGWSDLPPYANFQRHGSPVRILLIRHIIQLHSY